MNSDPNEEKTVTKKDKLDESMSSKGELDPRPFSLNLESSASETPFFYEDEVFRFTKKGQVKFGLVVQTPETYSGDEDDDDYDDLNKGDIIVSWYPENDEGVVRENQIGLADRSLMPGDIVRRLVPGKNTQRGVVRDIKVKADLKILGSKQIVKDISSDRLRSVHHWTNNAAVCLDSWVGSAKHIDELAIIRATNGAKLEVSSDRWHWFRQPKRRPFQDNQHFFVGNIVEGKIKDLLHLKKITPDISVPFCKKGTASFTVESITTQAIYVDWQCKALCEEQSVEHLANIKQPPRKIVGKDLDRLKQINLYDTCLLQLNDRCYMKFSKDDIVVDRRVWRTEMQNKFKKILVDQKEQIQHLNESGVGTPMSNTNVLEKLRKKFNLPAENERTGKTKKTFHKSDKNSSKSSNVHDSTDEEGEWESDCELDTGDEQCCEEDEESDQQSGGSNDSKNTYTSQKVTQKAYLPYYKKKYRTYRKHSSSSLRKEHVIKDGDEAVVESLVVYSRITVVWQDGTVESDIPSTQLYPIHHLDSHEYFPGDYVCCTREDINYNLSRDYGVIQSVDHVGRTALVKWFTVYTCLKKPVPDFNGETEVSVYDLKDHPDFQFRVGTMVIRVANFVGADSKSTAGQVLDCLPDGLLRVSWVDGHVSDCWPQDLFEVSPYEGQSDEEDDEDGDADSWETESQESEIGIQAPLIPKFTSIQSDFFANINLATSEIHKLEKLFAEQESDFVSIGVLRKLIILYKCCKQMDRMMNTNYFHDDYFKETIKKVNTTIKNAVTEAKISKSSSLSTIAYDLNMAGTNELTTENDFSPKIVFSTTSTPFKMALNSKTSNNSHFNIPANSQKNVEKSKNVEDNNKETAKKDLFKESSSKHEENRRASTDANESNASENTLQPKESYSAKEKRGGDTEKTRKTNKDSKEEPKIETGAVKKPHNSSSTPSRSDKSIRTQQYELLMSAVSCLDKVTDKCFLKRVVSDEDSGNFSRNDIDLSSTLMGSPSPEEMSISENGFNDSRVKTRSFVLEFNTASMCTHLCSIIKAQLMLYAQEVEEKFLKQEDILYEGKEAENEGEKDNNEDSGNDVKKPKLDKDVETKKDKSTPDESKPAEKDPSDAEMEESEETGNLCGGSFDIVPCVPQSHKFFSTTPKLKSPKSFLTAVGKEHHLMKTSLPANVWVKAFEDRMDLFSVMIGGPEKTPYEDGLFFFDIQLSDDYPKSPPTVHYISFCSDRLNPNLYEDGKVCVSLLGTWSGKGTEVWTNKSTLLQLIVSIQGLILVPQPYFNEAGYEKQKGTQQGEENSRMYNEMVILKFVQACTKMIANPPVLFKDILYKHFRDNALKMHNRFKSFMELSKENPSIKSDFGLIEFPLLPASRGFCLTLEGVLKSFYNAVEKHILETTGGENEKTKEESPDQPSTKASLAVAEELADDLEDNESESH